jgi:hypothetical protein
LGNFSDLGDVCGLRVIITAAVSHKVGEACVLGLEMSDEVIVHPHFYQPPPQPE